MTALPLKAAPFPEETLVLSHTQFVKRAHIGTLLRQQGLLSQAELDDVLTFQVGKNIPLGQLLRNRNLVRQQDLNAALSSQWELPFVDLNKFPAEGDLAKGLKPEVCLKARFLPWRHYKGNLVVVAADPGKFDAIRPELPQAIQNARVYLADEDQIERAITDHFQTELSFQADDRCPQTMSCRSWAKPLGRPIVFSVAALTLAIAALFPVMAMWIIFIWVLLNLLATGLLRLIALGINIRNRFRQHNKSDAVPQTADPPEDLPIVSVLVPLHKEGRILPLLIERLGKTDYPKDLLDICLVIEANDHQTREALGRCALPRWMRVIDVPEGKLKTKPRAMNYALDFCRGSIVGIYDAEDAPESDQITRFAQKFQKLGPEVACIQGYLDFYNPRQNWLSRCFTIEYAIWFRVVLHGIEKLGLPVPLGGTTVFFRREALEKLGAWDAYNVTEDADLGMRLARRGYRCAFLPTTTYEEANCRTIPWIRQRSRWLKGYGMTWITHMRHPVTLWNDLGPKGFLTFQVILLGTLSTFLLAPMIWSFWLIAFGFTPAFVDLLPPLAWRVLGVAFICSEIILIALGFAATATKGRRFLFPWIPTMIFYWPLGTLAAYKGMYELLLAPFYWDKTTHGISPKDRKRSPKPELDHADFPTVRSRKIST